MPVVSIKFDKHILTRNVEIKLMIDAIDVMLVNDIVAMYLNHFCFER